MSVAASRTHYAKHKARMESDPVYAAEYRATRNGQRQVRDAKAPDKAKARSKDNYRRNREKVMAKTKKQQEQFRIIAVRVTPEEFAQLTVVAKKRGASMNQFVRVALVKAGYLESF